MGGMVTFLAGSNLSNRSKMRAVGITPFDFYGSGS